MIVNGVYSQRRFSTFAHISAESLSLIVRLTGSHLRSRRSEEELVTLDKDAIRTETLPLMTLVDAGNVAQRGLEKRLSHLKLSVAQQRILALVYFAKENLTP